MNEIILIMIENKETVIGLLVALFSLLRLTTWGRAKGQALDTVIGVIESLDLKDAKTLVASHQTYLPTGARDALDHAVNKADAGKKPVPLVNRLAKEVFRGLK